MLRKLPSQTVWLGVGSLLMLAMTVLAGMQYRWITQVADAERDRLRAYVNTGTRQVSDELDREVSRIASMLLAGPPDLDSFAGRCQSFFDSQQGVVRLVRAIDAVDGPNLLTYDPAARKFVPKPWNADLERIRDHQQNGRPPRAFFFDPKLTALSLVRTFPPARRPERDDDGPGPPWRGLRRGPLEGPGQQWSILEFDAVYLRETLLPDLITRFLHTDDQQELAVRVVGADRETVLEINAAGVNFDPPEASNPLFSMRGIMQRAGFGPPGRPAPPGMEGPAGGWRIEVQHRAGSLEQAVARTRRNNLLLSGATLLFMAGAIGVVLVSTRRAQQLAHAQMEFVAGVSHELRTPVSVICSAADNLADGIVTGEQPVKRYGTLVRNEGRRLGGMIEQILRFASIQSGRARYDFRPVAVSRVVQSAMDACASTIQASSCLVEQNIPEGLPEIEADATALSHALRNLIENAIIHAGAGRWVSITAEERGGNVEISVADRGPGIRKEDQAHIFDPFYRGKRALDDQIHGFGLGLALVKRIVDAHGGQIALDSGDGGSKFTIRIAKGKA